MSGWGIFAIVLVVLFLIGQIRVGVDARYGGDGSLIKLRLGLLRIKVFPLPAKDKKKAKKKQKAKTKQSASPSRTDAQAVTDTAEPVPAIQAQPDSVSKTLDDRTEHAAAEKPSSGKASQKSEKQNDEQKEKMAGKKLSPDQILYLVQEFVPMILEAVSTLWSKLVMDELELSITVSSPDPADAAMLYGQINAAIGAVWQPLTKAFHIKNGRAHVDVDFQAQSITLNAHAALSLKVGQILWIVLYFGVRALKKFLKFRNVQKAKQQQRKAV